MNAAPILAFAVLLVAPIGSAQPGATVLDVTAHDDGLDFWFTIAGYPGHNPTVEIEAGSPIELTFHNQGTVQHNFHLASGQGVPCCVPVGANTTAHFTMPAGNVEYYCEPHHELGMRGTIVQPNAESNHSSTASSPTTSTRSPRGVPSLGAFEAAACLACLALLRRRL